MTATQLKQFDRYHEAVGAERYRVTAMRFKSDGSKAVFILDKVNGVTQGFTPEEIRERTLEMLRLQQRGENIYYTPLSEGKHHILIDDMSIGKLKKLIEDGYKPSVVIGSSPSNYQAIITIPKLGTVHDKAIGNRLVVILNHEYGDPKLSGCIHPHRAPGYENRKPKHQREDGSYPMVQLLKYASRMCEKTQALAMQIRATLSQQQAVQEALQAPQQIDPSIHRGKEIQEATTATGEATEAFKWHHQDVIRRMQGESVDLSRIDAMVAVRMRVMGYTRGEIEAALREYAPTTRLNGAGRNWGKYAERTATYAYSPERNQQIADLSRYLPQWKRLENDRE